MPKFKFTSAAGETISLTDGINYKLINIDKQTGVSALLSTLVTGGVDGDVVNSAQAQPRTIVLDIRIVNDVENTKRSLLHYFKLKQQGTLTWTQNERTLQIKGTVESIELSRWTNQSLMQIALHCSQPFWASLENVENDLQEFIGLHYFTNEPGNMLFFSETGIPFGEYNTDSSQEYYSDGDVAVGMEIEIIALDICTDPIIYNNRGEFFGCGIEGIAGRGVTMQQGDVIKINTTKNNKSATLNGESILGKIKPNSTWLQMEPGINSFSFDSLERRLYGVTNNMRVVMSYKLLFV